MRYLLLALLISFPAFAGDPGPGAPKKPLGEVIKGNIKTNDCVEVHWTKRKNGRPKVSYAKPTLKPGTISLLYKARSERKAVLRRCTE